MDEIKGQRPPKGTQNVVPKGFYFNTATVLEGRAKGKRVVAFAALLTDGRCFSFLLDPDEAAHVAANLIKLKGKIEREKAGPQ